MQPVQDAPCIFTSRKISLRIDIPAVEVNDITGNVTNAQRPGTSTHKLEYSIRYVYFCSGKSVRPAPTEFPQVWKEARVSSCSGAILGLPFFVGRVNV